MALRLFKNRKSSLNSTGITLYKDGTKVSSGLRLVRFVSGYVILGAVQRQTNKVARIFGDLKITELAPAPQKATQTLTIILGKAAQQIQLQDSILKIRIKQSR